MAVFFVVERGARYGANISAKQLALTDNFGIFSLAIEVDFANVARGQKIMSRKPEAPPSPVSVSEAKQRAAQRSAARCSIDASQKAAKTYGAGDEAAVA